MQEVVASWNKSLTLSTSLAVSPELRKLSLFFSPVSSMGLLQFWPDPQENSFLILQRRRQESVPGMSNKGIHKQ